MDQAYASAVRYRSEDPAQAAEKGAVAARALCWIKRISAWLTPGSRSIRMLSQLFRPQPSLEKKQGDVLIHLVLTPRDLPEVQSSNVIPDLKGAQFPEQVVIVSAHLDSWDLGTGALDDATGVGIAMDVLRIIKEINPTLRGRFDLSPG